MKKVNKIGERAIYRFKNSSTGEIVEEFFTAEDYNSRFLNGNDNPPEKEGHTWISASRIPEFDTGDGFLHDGEYAHETDTITGEEKILIQTKTKFISAHKKEIKDYKEKDKLPIGFEKLNKEERSQIKEISKEDL